VHCETRGRILRVIFDFHVYFLRAETSKILLVYPPFRCDLSSSSNTRNKNLKELGADIQAVFLGKQLQLDAASCEIFVTVTDIITSQNIDLSS
jgi:hypothetical protein